jgi:hypothetical protein
LAVAIYSRGIITERVVIVVAAALRSIIRGYSQ